MRHINLDLNVSYACNAQCEFCNRLIDLFHIPNSRMTVEQVERAIELWREANIYINKVKISGGEPSLHPQLKTIVALLLDSGLVGTVWVLSNGIIDKKELPELPAGARWRVDPILDKDNGWKNHQPFLVSPDDLGIRSPNCGKTCSTMRVCGRALEAFGFTFCGVAGALGHLLGIDVYSDEPVLEPDERVCKHCIYSLPLPQQQELQRQCPVSRWKDGVVYGDGIEYPTKTYKEALARYRKTPTRFPRKLEA